MEEKLKLEQVKEYLDLETKIIASVEHYETSYFLLKQFPERARKVIQSGRPLKIHPKEVGPGLFTQEQFNKSIIDRKNYFTEVSNKLIELKKYYCPTGSLWDVFREKLGDLSMEYKEKVMLESHLI